jgi:hypothetical protein
VRELARDTSDIVQKGNKSLADLVADLRKFSTNANASAAQ